MVYIIARMWVIFLEFVIRLEVVFLFFICVLEYVFEGLGFEFYEKYIFNVVFCVIESLGI